MNWVRIHTYLISDFVHSNLIREIIFKNLKITSSGNYYLDINIDLFGWEKNPYF